MCAVLSFFLSVCLSFFLSQSDFFYLPIVRAKGYCLDLITLNDTHIHTQ